MNVNNFKKEKMKKLIVLISLALLVGSNVYISRKSDNNFKITIELQNVALAEDENGGGVYECWTNMEYFHNSRVAECNTPCCIWEDKIEIGPKGGTCSGPLSPC